MSVAQSQPKLISEAEYLQAEQQASERHEYVNGQIYLMAGASKPHNRIVRNFITTLQAAAEQTGCEIFFSDIKVRAEKHRSYYYPDAVVGCTTADDDNEYYLEHPCLIVEVTSDSTIRKDYLEKALAYQSIPSLQAYIIVAQDKPQVDVLLRNTEGDWQLQQFTQLDEQITLPCLQTALLLKDLYTRVEM